MLKKFILFAYLLYKFKITNGTIVPKEVSRQELNYEFLEIYEGIDNNFKLEMHWDKHFKKHVETITSLIKRRSNLGKNMELREDPIFRGNENIYAKEIPFSIKNYMVVVDIPGTNVGNYRLIIPLDVLVMNNPFEGHEMKNLEDTSTTISIVLPTTKGYFFLESFLGVENKGKIVGFVDKNSEEILYTKYFLKDDEKKIVMSGHLPNTNDIDHATRSLVRTMRNKIFPAVETNKNEEIKNNKTGVDSASSGRQESKSKLKEKEKNKNKPSRKILSDSSIDQKFAPEGSPKPTENSPPKSPLSSDTANKNPLKRFRDKIKHTVKKTTPVECSQADQEGPTPMQSEISHSEPLEPTDIKSHLRRLKARGKKILKKINNKG